MNENTKKKLFYVSTFGIGYLIAKNKAKKIAANKNDEIKTSNEINFELNDFISCLGSKDNIIKIDYTISCLIIELKKYDGLDLEQFKQFNPKGIYLSGNKLNILFGDNSKYICEKMNELIA